MAYDLDIGWNFQTAVSTRVCPAPYESILNSLKAAYRLSVGLGSLGTTSQCPW